jgi:thiamine-phosphate pyrophosphorylase
VTPDATDTDVLLRNIDAAIVGGVRVVQYRNKDASPALRLEQAKALKALCASRDVALIVNDHIEVARAVDADGVHLGREDGSAAIGRDALGPHKLVGVSCYQSLARAHAAADEGADYVAFGSFFPSRVKPGAVRPPVDLLTQAKNELAVPIVAIGGITIENGGALVHAGADALAVISALFQASDVTAAAAGFAALFEANA